MLELHVLRHAKTEQFSPTGKDFDRSLMKKGLRQRDDLAVFFKKVNQVNVVWCSSATRTAKFNTIMGNCNGLVAVW